MGLWNRLIVGLLPLVPRFVVWRVARRYVAGPERSQALDVVRELNAQGADGTVALLGEHVAEIASAEAARDEYLGLIADIAEAGLHTGLSIKPSLLGLGVDPDLCERLTDSVFEAAAAHDLLCRIDMEDHDAVDASLGLHRRMHERHGNAGIVLQAYLHRTLRDIDTLPPDSNVRLCKGIYVEPRSLAWQGFDTVRANYVQALDKLLGKGHRVGIATHDERLVQAGVGLIDRYQVPRDRAEFQTLLGVDPPLRRLLLDQGHRVRVYVPYGQDWYAYSVRRLRENPKVAGYVMRAMFTGRGER